MHSRTRAWLVRKLHDATAAGPELAGVSLGLTEGGIPSLAPRYRAEAELARAAGADEGQIGQWIEVGRNRTGQARLTP
jgi:hypothetical protein